MAWFQTEWAFSQVAFVAQKAQARQIQLFEEMGMQLQYTLPKSVVYFPLYETTSPKGIGSIGKTQG